MSSLLVLIALGGACLLCLAGGFRGRRPGALRLGLRLARWAALLILVLALAPLVLVILLAIWFLVPRGRAWSAYWANVLGSATLGLWRKVFGPPVVAFRRARPSFSRRGRWWN